MDINSLLMATGVTGFFTSRAFLPAFMTAVTMRYGGDIALLSNLDMIQAVGTDPTLLTNNYVILVLGVLSALEISGEKIPEAQELINQFGTYIKPVMATLTVTGIMGGETSQQLESVLTQQAGVFALIPALILGAVVFFFSGTRASIIESLALADPDDHLGIRNLISWGEDLWASFGFLILLVFPVLMVLIIGLTIGLMFLFQRRLKKKEEQSKVECAGCGERIFRSAQHCPKCQAKQKDIYQVGWLGQVTDELVTDLSAHQHKLVEKKRCRVCATHLEKKLVDQACPVCADKPFADEDFTLTYMSGIATRLTVVILICAALSSIPVLGLIIGVIYYRIKLVTPFSVYIPMGKNFALKWCLRLFFLILIGIQWVPVAGAVVVPIMAFASYMLYRGSFAKQLKGA